MWLIYVHVQTKLSYTLAHELSPQPPPPFVHTLPGTLFVDVHRRGGVYPPRFHWGHSPGTLWSLGSGLGRHQGNIHSSQGDFVSIYMYTWNRLASFPGRVGTRLGTGYTSKNVVSHYTSKNVVSHLGVN